MVTTDEGNPREPHVKSELQCHICNGTTPLYTYGAVPGKTLGMDAIKKSHILPWLQVSSADTVDK